MKPIDSVWTEKYRPKKISYMVGDFKEKLLKYIENPDSMPHFLLHSKTPGTGKTTLAKAIVNELGCDVLILNSSDDRKIEVVREKVKSFCATKSSIPGMRRCVFMDEFDGMLKASQEALRNIMETYVKNAFFILTCNNINKVIEPLQSRCQLVAFAYPNKEEVFKYLKQICERETLESTDEGINLVIEKNYPSIRNCVQCLQDIATDKKSVTPENIEAMNEIFEELWTLLKNKNWKEIKKLVLESTVDPKDVNSYYWKKALEEDNIKLIQLTCRNEKDIAWGADSKIVFVTSLIEMVK